MVAVVSDAAWSWYLNTANNSSHHRTQAASASPVTALLFSPWEETIDFFTCLCWNYVLIYISQQGHLWSPRAERKYFPFYSFKISTHGVLGPGAVVKISFKVRLLCGVSLNQRNSPANSQYEIWRIGVVNGINCSFSLRQHIKPNWWWKKNPNIPFKIQILKVCKLSWAMKSFSK